MGRRRRFRGFVYECEYPLSVLPPTSCVCSFCSFLHLDSLFLFSSVTRRQATSFGPSFSLSGFSNGFQENSGIGRHPCIFCFTYQASRRLERRRLASVGVRGAITWLATQLPTCPLAVLILVFQITTSNKIVPEDRQAAAWSATWSYPPGPADEPVHAFPNVKLEINDTLPARIGDITSIPISTVWSYGLGNNIQNGTNNTILEAAKVNANVAIDMFIANNKTNADSTTESDFEIMIWFGRWGEATDPIGLLQGSKATHEINGTTL